MSSDITLSPAGRAAAAAALDWHAGRSEPQSDANADDGPATTLAQVVPLVRSRLRLDGDVSDATIVGALAAITARSDQRGRWMAAFNSDLGQALAAHGRDLNTALRVLIALAPGARS